MSEKLEVTVDIDLSNLNEKLSQAKKLISDAWKDMEKQASTSASKAATASIDADKKKLDSTKKTTKAQAVSMKSLSDLSINEVERLKTKVISNMEKIDAAFKLDPAKNTRAMKEREAEIRRTWITAKDTGKKLDKMAENRYIELKIEKNKMVNDLNKVKSLIAKATLSQHVDIDIDKDKVKKQLVEVRAELKKATKSWNDNIIHLSISKEEELIRKLKYLEARKKAVTKTATLKIRMETDDVKAAFSETNREIKNLETQWKSSMSRIWKHVNNITNSIKTGLATMISWFVVLQWIRNLIQWLNDAKNVALQWESSFTGVKKTTKATAEEFKKLNKELVQLTKEIPSTYEEITKIAELWWQMWVPIDQLKAFTEAVAMIGTTTNLSIEQAATQFARLHNIMWLPLDRIDETASAVVSLGNNFAAQEDEILNFTTRIAGSWKVAKMTVWQLTWIATALTSVGIKAEMWWSAVSKAMLEMNSAVSNWWKELEWFAKTSWLSSKEFKDMWKDDAAWAFTLFVEWLWKAWDKADAVIAWLLWDNVRTKQSFLNLAWAGDLLRRAIENGTEARKLNLALSKEAQLRYGTEASQLKILTNKYEEQQNIMWWQLVWSYKNLTKLKLSFLTWIVKLSEALWGMSVILTWLVWILWVLAVAFGIISTPILLVIWAVAAVAGWIALLWRETSWYISEVEKLEGRMIDLTKSMEANKNEQSKVEQQYISGKISLEEYRSEMEKLYSEELKMNKIRSEVADDLWKQNWMQNKMTETKRKHKDLLAEESVATKEATKSQEKYNDKKAELDRLFFNGVITQKEYNEQLDLSNKENIKYQSSLLSIKAAVSQSSKAMENKRLILRALVETTNNDIEVEERYNELKIDNTDDVTQILNKTNALAEEIAKGREAIGVDLARKKVELALAKETDSWRRWAAKSALKFVSIFSPWVWIWMKWLEDWKNKITNNLVQEVDKLQKAFDDLGELKVEPIKVVDPASAWNAEKIASALWSMSESAEQSYLMFESE